MQQQQIRIISVRPKTGEDLVRFLRRSELKTVLRERRVQEMSFT